VSHGRCEINGGHQAQWLGSSQPEQWAELQIVAIVELDMQKMWVRIVLTRETIRQRLRELEHLSARQGEPEGIEQAT